MSPTTPTRTATATTATTGVAGARPSQRRLPIYAGQRLRSFADVLGMARAGATRLATPATTVPASQPVGAVGPAGTTLAAGPAGGVTPTSGVGAAKAASRPMALADFPRPATDNGRGIHWVPTGTQPKEAVDQFVQEAREMKITWVTFLNDDSLTGTNDYLVKQLTAAGIMPIMRVYTPAGRPIQGDLGAMVRHYKALGVQYFQLYNEPNNNDENVDGKPNVERYLDQWTTAARTVVAAGGLPGFGALSPGGNSDDLKFLDSALAGLKRRGQTHLLDRAWVALHNYTFNRPVDFSGDQHSYTKFRLYNDIVQRHLGRSLPMIATEGGTHPGMDFDKGYQVVDEARQTQLVLDGYRYMDRPTRESYYFANSFWVIANELGGGSEPGWNKHALFQRGHTSPIVDWLKKN